MAGHAAQVESAERVDRLCDQFETAWTRGDAPSIESYLAAATEADRHSLLTGLVGLEIELRQRQGERPNDEEYLARFPQRADDIRAAFAEVHSVYSSVKLATAETSKGPIAPVPPATSAAQSLTQLGRFQIVAVLGEGAFGTVYKAHDPQLDRDVAVKVPRAGALQNKEDRERFLREARAAAGLQHAQICPVYEVGTIDGRDYIVMAFIDGKPLSKVMQAPAKLSDKQIITVIRKLALALQEAHDKGVIHRDLKPANIMINRKGEPVIMDFGLARRSNAGDAQISQSGQIMGTPAYMSPEQARGDGKAVGPAADIYGLGMMLYELLCGRRPFEGTITEVIGQILHIEPKPPSQYRADVDARLEQICLKAIAKQPADRFGSMKEFAAALADHAKTAATLSPNAAETATKPAKTDSLPVNQIAQLMEAVSSDLEEKVERAAQRAVRTSHSFQRANVPWWTYLVGSGLMGVIVLLGIFFFIRKGTVTVIVNIPLENINDPSLSFLLDNQPIAAEKFAAPIELKPGEHELIVKKDGQEFKRFLFNVGKADNQPVIVQDVTPKATETPQRPTGPHRVEISELNLTGYDTLPWMSVDGLTIYWEGENPKGRGTVEEGPWVYSARRPDAQSPFAGIKPLFPARHPTLTGDELEMVFVRGRQGAGSMRFAKRNSTSESFVPSGEIPELVGQANPKGPFFTEDGLMLVFQRVRQEQNSVEFVYCTRSNRTSAWSTPQPLPMSADPTRAGPVTWPFLSRDGLTLWYCHGGDRAPEICKATRSDRNAPFGNHQPVIVEGTPLIGRAPRFVAATGELFYSPNLSLERMDWSLWVVKDFASPAAIVAGPRISECPLDALDPADIPEPERKPLHPPELVAVLGSTGMRIVALSLAFSPDQALVAAGGEQEKSVKVWDVASGKEVLHLGEFPGWVTGLAFSPDGKRLYAGSGDEIRVIDFATRNTLHTWRGQRGGLADMALSPDGKLLVAAGGLQHGQGLGENLEVWDTNSGELLRTAKGNFRSVAFSPDGQTLAVGRYPNAALWDVTTLTEKQLLEESVETPWVAYSGNGKFIAVAGGTDTKARIYDADTGKLHRTIACNQANVVRVAFQDNGQVLATGSDNATVKLWETATGQEIRTLTGHKAPILTLAMTPDGQTVATGAEDGTLRLWEAATGRELFPRTGAQDVGAIAVSPNGGTIATAGVTIRLWDASTGKVRRSLVLHRGSVGGVAFSPDGSTLASSGSGTVRFWDPATGDERQSFTGLSDKLGQVAYSPDGRLLAVVRKESADNAEVWDLTTGKLRHTLKGRDDPGTRGYLRGVAFSPTESLLATSSGPEIVLWNPATGEKLDSLTVDGNEVNDIAFSPDGRRLAACYFGDLLKVWDVAMRKELRTLRGHGDNLSGVAWSPDGKWLASAGADGTVRLWDGETGAAGKVFRLHSPSGHLGRLTFSPEGRHLLVNSGQGTVHVLRLRPPGAAHELQAR